MMAMAMTPLEEARYALNFGVNRSDLSMPAQLEYDRLVTEGYGTPPVTLTRDEYKQAQRERREQARRELEAALKVAEATAWFPNLGIAVRDGNVYRHGADRSDGFDAQASRERTGRAEMKLLAPLAGAHADVLAGKTQKRRRTGSERAGDVVALAPVVGPFALLAGFSRAGTGVAVVTFADGNVREKEFTDKSSLLTAQAEAVKFNALAASSRPADGPVSGSAESPAQGDTGIAAELERLAALHPSGVLAEGEFRAANARILGG